MLKKKSYDVLLELGAHIGAKTNINSRYLFYYTVGRRSNRYIFNINITMYLLQRACLFMQQIGAQNGNCLFFYSDLYKQPKAIQLAMSSILYNTSHSFVNQRWSPGMLSNFFTSFQTIMRFIIPEAITKHNMNIRWLLYTILFYLFDNKMASDNWEEYIKANKKFWRLLVYFQGYRIYNKIPEVVVLINPKLSYSAAIESYNAGIASIGTIDTDSKVSSFTYPIASNDDSLLLALFYFMLFSRCYTNGKLRQYNKYISII